MNWLLWNTATNSALIVNPEEAELLIPTLREAQSPETHLLTYAAPVTRRMLHFNQLRFFAIPDLPAEWEAPEWLRIELGIFAGRLYFEESEYRGLCQYLRIKTSHFEEGPEENLPLECSESIHEETDDEANLLSLQQGTPPFTAKPLVFLQQWLAVRRKGQEFANTPMGYVCQGKLLTKDHPFFARERPDSSHSSDQSEAPQRSKRYGASKATAAVDSEDDFDEDFDENEVVDVGNGDGEYFDALEDQNEAYSGDYDV